MKQKNLVAWILAFSAVALLMTACQQEDKNASHDQEVKDYVSLLDNLRASGATVEPVEEIESAFSVKGNVIKVNGKDVQVYEYPNDVAAKNDANKVSSDGSSIGTSMITWIDTPHFYQKGKLIVTYIGKDENTIKLLEEELGQQFAGGKNTKDISSFEECAAAGYPVGESYPRQCFAPGKTFVEKLVEDKEKIQTESACKDLCGDGVCQEIVCLAIGCPCAESKETCPQDCK